jgi:hypothetical protein
MIAAFLASITCFLWRNKYKIKKIQETLRRKMLGGLIEAKKVYNSAICDKPVSIFFK